MTPTPHQKIFEILPFIQTLVEETDHIIFGKDRDGRFTFINSAGARLLNLDPLEIIGKTSIDLFGPTLGFEAWEFDRLVFTSGKPYTGVTKWRIQEDEVSLQTTKYPVNGPNGATTGIFGFSQTVSSIKPIQPDTRTETQNTKITSKTSEAEEVNQPPQIKPPENWATTHPSTLNRTLLTLQSAIVAVASSLNLDHILDTLTWEMVHLLNVDNCLIFNWEPEEETISLASLYVSNKEYRKNKAHKLEELTIYRQVIAERRPVQIRIDQLRPTQGENALMTALNIQAMILLPMIFQEKIVGLVGLIEHEKQRVFTDWEISLAQMLANQAANSIVNAQLYEKLNEVNRALQVSNEELDAFAHTVAHDLKGPLGRMLGFSDIILHEGAGLSPEELRDLLQIVVNNSQKMNDIINGLLLLSTVRQEEINSDHLDIMHTLLEARQRLRFQLEESRAVMNLPEKLPTAWGVGPWIEEVWTNYLSNAIKYGGTPPQIEIGATRQADGKIRYWVRDNGAGLSPSQQAKLFTPFTRLNQVAVEGHGLGLSIVRRIVEKLGGEVGVASSIGQGSTFFFTLPAEQNLG